MAYTTHQYQLEHAASAYLVQFVDYPKDVVVADPQWVLRQALDRTAAGMDGGKWTSSNFTKLKGALAVDAVGQRGGSEVRSYMVLKGRQLYTLIHIGAAGSAALTGHRAVRRLAQDRAVAADSLSPFLRPAEHGFAMTRGSG